MEDHHLQKLKAALQDRECTIIPQSKVMELIFKKKEDADWFNDLYSSIEEGSPVSCMMSLKSPGKSQYKFIFNIQDIDLFLKIMDEK